MSNFDLFDGEGLEYHHIQRLRAEQQRKEVMGKMDKLLRAQKTSYSSSRQCPWCGGALAGNFEKCMHCASPISWVSGIACKPGTRPEIQNCPRGHGLMRKWEGSMRCWTCGYPGK